MKKTCKSLFRTVLLGATLLTPSTSAWAMTTPPQTVAEHLVTDTLIETTFTTLTQYIIELLRGMTGQLSAADQIKSRQMGGYFDGQIQEMYKIANSEAIYQSQQDSTPPRTLCETATGLAGAAAAEQNTRAVQKFVSDVQVASLTNRQGGPSANGPLAHAQYRAGEILSLYCDPDTFNTDNYTPCYNSSPAMVDADIDPTKTLLNPDLVLDDEGFDAANAYISNLVQPVSNEPIRGGALAPQEGRLLYAERRGHDARKGMAIAALSGLVADMTPTTPMAGYISSLTGDTITNADGSAATNTSKMKLLSALLSDRFLNGTYQLKLNDMNNSTVLLREANNNFANIQVGMFELLEQNRKLIALNATLLAIASDTASAASPAEISTDVITIGTEN